MSRRTPAGTKGLSMRKGLPSWRRPPVMPHYEPGTLAMEVMHHIGPYGPYELHGPVPTEQWPDKPALLGEICGEYSYIGYRDIPTCDLWPLLETADMEGATTKAHEIREELKRRQARGENLWPASN